jgi:hypothetical protein
MIDRIILSSTLATRSPNLAKFEAVSIFPLSNCRQPSNGSQIIKSDKQSLPHTLRYRDHIAWLRFFGVSSITVYYSERQCEFKRATVFDVVQQYV